jgi:hypothetical protein
VKIPPRWLPVAAILFLAACSHTMRDRDAVQRGVMDRLSAAGLSMQNMDVNVTDVQFNGDKADAVVEVRPKGSPGAQGMKMHYGLENQKGKWVVVSRADMAGHGGTVAPGSGNPHGGAAPEMPPAGHGAMPSPQDLPPAGKKQ